MPKSNLTAISYRRTAKRRRTPHSNYTGGVCESELLTSEFDEGNDDVDQIRSSLGVASNRRPASE